MIKIFHNPRCTKSREGLEILEKSGRDFEVIKYLEEVPTKKELQEIIRLLGIKPEQLIRKNETVWKEKYRDKKLSQDAFVDAMIDYPGLIERPVVINGTQAVIGRPPKKILEII